MTMILPLVMFVVLQILAFALFAGSVWLGNAMRRRRRGLAARNVRIQTPHVSEAVDATS